MKFDKIPRKLEIGLLVLAAALVWIYARTAPPGFALDDSWIHQVYGRNLAQTGQWAFLPDVPSAASTSPLFTVLLSFGYVVNFPYALWTQLLGIVALWVNGVLAVRIMARLVPGRPALAALTGAAMVLAWHLIWAAASGMETMMFTMFTSLLLFLALRESGFQLGKAPLKVDHSRQALLQRAVSFGACAGLAVLARPEGAVLTALIALFILVLRPQRSWTDFLFWSMIALATFSMVLMPYLMLNWQLTGGLLPDTAAAKQAQLAFRIEGMTLLERIWMMLWPLLAGAQFLLVPGVFYYLWTIIPRLRVDRYVAWALLPLTFTAVQIVLYAARLPSPIQHARYVIPALPSIIICGILGTVWLVERGRRQFATRVLTRTLMISAALGFFVFGLWVGPNEFRKDVSAINEEMVASAHWIDQNIPRDQLLATHDIGAIGFFTPRPLVDVAGLISPEVVPFIDDGERLWAYLQQRGVQYLMALPDQVPGDDITDKRLCPIYSTGGATAQSIGYPNMTVYKLVWDRVCTPAAPGSG
jgi:hypothetical protein